MKKNSYTKKSNRHADVRYGEHTAQEVSTDEIYKCVEESVTSLLVCRNHKHFGAILIAELVCNISALLSNKKADD